MKVLALFALSSLISIPLAAKDKPCIMFASGNTPPSSTDLTAREYLQTAITLSGDFVFYPDTHFGCWIVNVLTLNVQSTTGYSMAYVISWTITKDNFVLIAHGLRSGPTIEIFDTAMRFAAADVISDIRLTAKAGAPSQP